MQYFGGKKRIARQLIEFLRHYQDGTDGYLEPFVGSACIIQGLQGKRFGSDKNEYLIEMYKALQLGWTPPTIITPVQYSYIKEHKDENKILTGFVGFGCSYAKNNTLRNYALGAYNGLMKQLPLIQTVSFDAREYQTYTPENLLIYCDPPYQGTTQYGATGKFNTQEFWTIMREWSKTNKVFISEYSAPLDFKCVFEIKTKTDIRTTKNGKENRLEKVFTLGE